MWPGSADSLSVEAHAADLNELERLTERRRSQLQRGEAIEETLTGEQAMITVLTDDSTLDEAAAVGPSDPARAIELAMGLAKPSR